MNETTLKAKKSTQTKLLLRACVLLSQLKIAVTLKSGKI